jgi:nicotinamidase-related amidase
MDDTRGPQGLHPPLPIPDLKGNRAALLVVDMQYGDAHREYGSVRHRFDRGEAAEISYYIDRIESLVVPNIMRLEEAFRARHKEVIHTRIRSYTQDGRERSRQHKDLDILWPPGSKEAEILDDVAPLANEIVLDKTCGGVFNGTPLDYILRNLSIETLVVTGVVETGCVESAIRDASDKGYAVVLPEDATATWSPELHKAAIRLLNEIYCKVMTTDQVMSLLTSPVHDRSSGIRVGVRA